MNNHTYIYESPDNGVTIYKRKFMDYENKTEIIPKRIFALRDNYTKKQKDLQDSNLFDKFLSYLDTNKFNWKKIPKKYKMIGYIEGNWKKIPKI